MPYVWNQTLLSRQIKCIQFNALRIDFSGLRFLKLKDVENIQESKEHDVTYPKNPGTVDGSDPANHLKNVDITLFAEFYASQVVKDFFHQQYVLRFRDYPYIPILRMELEPPNPILGRDLDS